MNAEEKLKEIRKLKKEQEECSFNPEIVRNIQNEIDALIEE